MTKLIRTGVTTITTNLNELQDTLDLLSSPHTIWCFIILQEWYEKSKCFLSMLKVNGTQVARLLIGPLYTIGVLSRENQGVNIIKTHVRKRLD